jgi:DNA-binding NarL/FixJ family response regulator
MKRISENPSFKVLLLEDPLCRRNAFDICNRINQFPPSQVSARIADAEDAMRAISMFNADIVLIDLNSIQRSQALRYAEEMRMISPMLKVIFSNDSPPPVLDGDAYVTALSGWCYWLNAEIFSKGDIAALLEAISLVIRGDVQMSKKIHDQFLSKDDFLGELNEQQRLTIELLSKGLSNKEIARIADLKVKTVERNIARATQILGVEGSENENNKRIMLVLEYLRRVEHVATAESLYS